MPEHYMTRFTAAGLLKQLYAKGFISEEQEVKKFICAHQGEDELPLYLRVFVGVGVFIASLCFIGSLNTANIIDWNSESSFIFFWSIVFVVAAISLHMLARDKADIVKHSFLIQTSLVSMATGKTLFVFGVTLLMNIGWGISLGTLIITSVTYYVYRISLDRFLSSFAVLFSFLLNIVWNQDIIGSRALLLNLFFLLQMPLVAILVSHGKIKKDYVPLCYAFICSLSASVLFLEFKPKFAYWTNKEVISPIFIKLMLIVGLLALIGWSAGNLRRLKSEALLTACGGVICLGFISTPGVILSITLLLLGYARHDRLLLTLGGFFFPIFLFLYYYNLDVSLAQKSGILLGSGATLLFARYYLRLRKWDQGNLA